MGSTPVSSCNSCNSAVCASAFPLSCPASGQPGTSSASCSSGGTTGTASAGGAIYLYSDSSCTNNFITQPFTVGTCQGMEYDGDTVSILVCGTAYTFACSCWQYDCLLIAPVLCLLYCLLLFTLQLTTVTGNQMQWRLLRRHHVWLEWY